MDERTAMNSLIFRVISSHLFYVLHFVALWLLIRGHNSPGGGFVAGLISGSAFCILAMANRYDTVAVNLRKNVMPLVGVGLLISFLSAAYPLLDGKAFFTGIWGHPFGIHIGTPVFFDIGVYLVVLGVVVGIVFNLLEVNQEKK